MKERNMKAWVVTKEKKLELISVPIPLPGDDEVLVKTTVSCLCNGSDPGIYNGHEAYKLPFAFGHESTGTVVKKGKNVKNVEIGDLVFCWCAMGSFAEYQIMSQSGTALFKVPANVTPDQGPILELVIAACRGLMSHPAQGLDETITICGLGPSGLVLLQYARALGYKKIIGWDLYESRRQLALELGADMVFDPSTLTPEKACAMPLANISVDMMGDDKLQGKPTLTLLMRATAQGGTVISYGHPESGRMFSPYVFQSRNLKMISPENNLNVIREQGKKVLNYVSSGIIKIEPLITHRLKFADIGSAFSKLLNTPDAQIKVIFTMEEEE